MNKYTFTVRPHAMDNVTVVVIHESFEKAEISARELAVDVFGVINFKMNITRVEEVSTEYT